MRVVPARVQWRMQLVRLSLAFAASSGLLACARRDEIQYDLSEPASQAIEQSSSMHEQRASVAWLSSIRGDDTCFNTGHCSRLVVDKGNDAVSIAGDKVMVRFRSCALFDGGPRWLPQRFAYGDADEKTMNFTKTDLNRFVGNYYRWQVPMGGYIKHVFAVKVGVRALHGAHRTKDAHHPPLDDADLRKKNENSILISSSEQFGDLSAGQLSSMLNSSKYQSHAGVGEEIRIVVDIKAEAQKNANCPPLGPTGNHAYTGADHFKLMQLGVGTAACKDMRKKQGWALEDTEFYCLDPDPDAPSLRAWAIAVDMRLAKPLVRDPTWEGKKGRASELLKKELTDLANQWTEDLKKRKDSPWPSNTSGWDVLWHQCRYKSYAPEEYLKQLKQIEEKQVEAEQIKVMLNANFFLFVDVRSYPCATPTGPVVADGHVVQSWRQTGEDLLYWHGGLARFQITHSLVMVKGEGAFIMESDQFDGWFNTLDTDARAKISVVTGHQVLEGGKPTGANNLKHLRADERKFWKQKAARTVIGLQHHGRCAEWLHTDKACAHMILILQFEKKSEGRAHFSHFHGEDMYAGTRVDSQGADMETVQSALQFLMLDAAINFDGSGSSSLWTSIGNLPEKRSQPSDSMHHGASYHFRPSPTLLGFSEL